MSNRDNQKCQTCYGEGAYPANSLLVCPDCHGSGQTDTKEPVDPFDFVEPCEPDCSPERHAYHRGQWDMAARMYYDARAKVKVRGGK